jgi:hypothetical protein
MLRKEKNAKTGMVKMMRMICLCSEGTEKWVACLKIRKTVVTRARAKQAPEVMVAIEWKVRLPAIGTMSRRKVSRDRKE